MLAFHSDPAIKAKFVQRAIQHREADEILQNYGYWRNGKGCAIGCLAHANENAHEALDKEAGLPAVLNHLADRIFEKLPKDKYRDWPRRYIDAPDPGADLTLVLPRFMVWLLTEKLTQYFDAEKFLGSAVVCNRVAGLYQRVVDGGTVTDQEWKDAADGADAVRAAYSVDTAYSADAARAAYAARAAFAAARAARAARAVDAARAAYAVDAVDAAYEHMADKLIELLKAAPVPAKEAERGRGKA